LSCEKVPKCVGAAQSETSRHCHSSTARFPGFNEIRGHSLGGALSRLRFTDSAYSLSMAVQFVLDDLTIQSIPMDTKDSCCLGLISICFGKGGLNEFLFELIQSFI
jgi:hypothetical protein